MTTIIDTSVWIALFRDKTGQVAAQIRSAVAEDNVASVGPVRLELLQGCRSDDEWKAIEQRLAGFEELRFPPDIWHAAARIYFDLRRRGLTVRSALDCSIAALSLHHGCTLIHNDRDFETIAAVTPLKHLRLKFDKSAP